MYKYIITDYLQIKPYELDDEYVFGEKFCFESFHEAKKSLLEFLNRRLEELIKLRAQDFK